MLGPRSSSAAVAALAIRRALRIDANGTNGALSPSAFCGTGVAS